MKKKIKSITIEVRCTNSKCLERYEVTSTDVKNAYHTCDCDYPCDCKNGPYMYFTYSCPICGGRGETTIEIDK